MNNFDLNNYDIFTTAYDTTILKKNMLLNESNAVNTNVSGLNDETVFQGMICESIVNGWESIKKTLDTAINEMNTTANIIQSIRNNYVLSDSTNESEIGGV